MPAFLSDQEDEMHVWDMGYAAAEAAGYFSWKKAKSDRVLNPLAATAFAAGFMGGAFLGKLPSWIEHSLEPDVLGWIRQGCTASKTLNGQYVGKPYDANTGDAPASEEVVEEQNISGIRMTISIENSRSKEVEMFTGALDGEIWRPVIGYPGGFISNLGRARDWKDFRKARLSPSHVYPHIELPYGGSEPIHLLVAEMWLGAPPLKGLVVCHHNDNKFDARAVNLRYDTQKANAADRVRNRKKVARQD